MKKIIIMGIILFLTSGCDNNLNCKKTAKYDGVNFNIQVKGNFDGAHLNSLELNNKASLTGNYKNYDEVFNKTLEDYLNKFKGENIKSSVDNNNLEFMVKISSFDKKISYKSLKQSLEDEGYKCE